MYENYTRTQIIVFIVVMAVLTVLTVWGVNYAFNAFVVQPVK
jgi:hypothetical protein